MNEFRLEDSKLQFNKEFLYLTEEQLPKKVAAITESVTELYNNGTTFSKMTISEIAKRANIGKGTVYEYFTSKEEIIITVMLLELKKELTKICNAIIAKESFQEKYDTTLYWIKDRVQTNILLRQMMLARYSENSDEAICELVKRMMSFTEVSQTLESIIKAGIEEDLFQKPQSVLQEKSAFATLIFGVSALLKPEEYGDAKEEDTVSYCRSLFIQILKGFRA
ncbi:MAG: TetR/AcrR family transcriptional regulator [Clostridiales bacterium]|nr:TetR/AcrR family transcriptional regulator [Clostridiales bacterium]